MKPIARMVALVLFAVGCARLAPGAEPDSLLEGMVQTLRSGRALGVGEVAAAIGAFDRYHRDLNRQYPNSHINFPEPVRTQRFINNVRLSMIDPEGHWHEPFTDHSRHNVLPYLMREYDATFNPLVLYCTVFPASDSGHLDHAVRAYETLLETDRFLARQVVWLSSRQRLAPSWLVAYYVDRQELDEAKQALALVDDGGDVRWKETQAFLFEKQGDHVRACSLYQQISESTKTPRTLLGFYQRNADLQDGQGVTYRRRLEELTNRIFPAGMRRVGLHSFADAPRAGVAMKGFSFAARKIGLLKDSVVVAVDGVEIVNSEQYKFVRDLDAANPRMELIFWNGDRYVATTVTLTDRRFGLSLEDYAP